MPDIDTYYLDSDKVNVFPSTRRIYTQDYSAKLVTESAIARIVNEFLSTDGFIISRSLSSINFELNIAGYYFQIKGTSQIPGATLISDLFTGTDATDIYASIMLDISNNYPELVVPAELNPGTTPATYATTGVSYSAGDLVTYNGNQYQCLVDISAPAGSFDSSKWVQLSSTFNGLIFSAQVPTNPASGFTYKSLLIMSKVDNTWQLNSDSLYWFDISEIDGGVVSV